MGDPTPPPVVIHNTIEKSKPLSLRGVLTAFVICSIVLVLGLWLFGVRFPGASAAPLPPAPSIAQIQSMSDLATANVHISDYIELENNHYVGRWTLHGEVVLGVNLAEARYVKTDEKSRQAILHLPKPHLISSKVDHERSEKIYIKSKVYFAGARSSTELLESVVWKEADRKIQRLANEEPGYSERAKVQAERTLEQLFKGVGWSIDFEWE
jgi:hypothetical protein